MTAPDVSIILVSWNTCSQTRACLESLPGAVDDGLRYEVVAVDNGSGDGSGDLLASWPGLIFVQNETNVGYAAAVNQAYRAASANLVLLLNSDVRFLPGALSVLVGFLREHPTAAGVTPMSVDSQDRVQPHFMRLPTLLSALSMATALRWLPPFRQALRRQLMADANFSRPLPVPQPSATCLLLRRRILGRDTIFDERLPIYFNDVYLAHTLAGRGHQLWMTPRAVVRHELGASTRLLDAAVRSRHRLGALVIYLRSTEPTRRVRVFQAAVFVDGLIRRAARASGNMPVRHLLAAIAGDVGPLPGLDRRAWLVMVPTAAWSEDGVRQHELALALAGEYRVLYLDSATRRPRVRLTVQQVGPAIWRAAGPSLQPATRVLPVANRVERRVNAALVRRWLDRRPGRRVLWMDDERAVPMTGRLGENMFVYDAVDLNWTFGSPRRRARMRRNLQQAVGRADLVLASSPALPEQLPPTRRPPVVVANGCDPDRFAVTGTVSEWASALPSPRLVMPAHRHPGVRR